LPKTPQRIRRNALDFRWSTEQQEENAKAIDGIKELLGLLESPEVKSSGEAYVTQLARNPDDLYRKLAQLLIREKRPDEALAYLAKIKTDENGAFVIDHLKGEAYRLQGNVEKAEEQFLQLVARKTPIVPTYLGLVDVYREKGNYADALVVIARALGNGLNHSALFEMVDKILGNVKDDATFVAEYAAYEGLEKENFGYFFLLGNYYHDRFVRFLKENEKGIPRRKKGRLVEGDERYAKGLAAFESAVEKKPDFAPSYILYASLYAVNNEYENAAKVLERGLNNKLGLGIIYRYYGMYLSRLEKNEESVQALRKAILIAGGEDTDARLLLSMVLDKMGKKEEAEAELKIVLKKEPDNAVANNALGYIWAQQGRNLEEAMRLIEKALAKEPENGAYIDSLGWVYFQMGRYKRALSKLKEASQREEDAVIFDHLGDAYRKLKKEKEARKAYKRALEIDPEAEGVKEKLESLN